jgi:hypothetical protein
MGAGRALNPWGRTGWEPGGAFVDEVCKAPPASPTLFALKAWLGSWRGVGLVTDSMSRQGYDLALTSDEHGWRATFLHRDHLVRPWVGQVLAWWSTPWRAVQEAAWRALNARQAQDVSPTEESPP